MSSRRWLLSFVALLLLPGSSASAQTPGFVPYTNVAAQGPVMVNHFGGADPYATVGSQPANWWSGPWLALPTAPTIQNRLWYRVEYLRWRTEGMDVPALVTTSPPGTAQSQAGVLGEPDTIAIFGPGEINGSSTNGFRSRSGFWFRDGAFGIESELIRLEDEDDGFAAASDGTTILARPFFDILNGQETAQLISFPGLVSGNIIIGSRSRLRSFMISGRASLNPLTGSPFNSGNMPDRVDAIIGYRYLDLDDQLTFGNNLTSLVPAAPGTVAIAESFRTENEFNGLQLGVTYLANFRRGWLESLIRVGIGGTKQSVAIRGNTAITEAGVTENFVGGLLAQRSNIGSYERDQFTMIPEFGLTFGFRLRDWLHATIGYSVMYFPSVVRASEQIETDLNPNLIPEEAVPFAGALRPRFRFIESDYWAEGINLGAELRF